MFLHLRLHGILVRFPPLPEGSFHDSDLVVLVNELLPLTLEESSSPHRVGVTDQMSVLAFCGIDCSLLDLLVVDSLLQDLLETLSHLDPPLGSFNLDAGQ